MKRFSTNLVDKPRDFSTQETHSGHWILVLPREVTIDPGLLGRVERFDFSAASEETVYCGAGIHPAFLSEASGRLVSFCFDERNSPSHKSPSIRVYQILNSPLLIPAAIFEKLDASNCSDFSHLLDLLNRLVASFEIRALAVSILNFGYGNRALITTQAFRNPKSQDRFAIPRRLSIVTRTGLGRESYLVRNMESVDRFAELAFPLEIEHIIVHQDAESSISEKPWRRIVKNNSFQTTPSRLSNLLKGAKLATGDFVMFLDDDDFLNEGLAGFFSFVMLFEAESRFFVFDSQHVIDSSSDLRITPPDRLGHRYTAFDVLSSLLGPNRTPISSIVYPVHSLAALNRLHDCPQLPSLLEDHLIMNLALMGSESQLAFVPEVLSWISLHSSHQSVSRPNEPEWIDSVNKVRAILFSESNLPLQNRQIELFKSYRVSRGNKRTRVRSLFSLFELTNLRTVFYLGIHRQILNGRLPLIEVWKRYRSHL